MHHSRDEQPTVPPSTPSTARRPLLRAMAGAGVLGAFGLPRLAGAARAAIPGVDVDYKRCKVAFVSNASSLDAIAVYYADRDGERDARYGIDPTTTDPRGYDPLVVEYDAAQDRTQIQVAEARASLVCVVAEAASGRVAVTNPNDVCVPSGFNAAPTAAFTVSEAPTVGEPVTFTSTATDPDTPERLYYEWDLDGDGTFETTGATVSRTYVAPGDVTVAHRVTDDCGASDSTTGVVTVAPDAPTLPTDLVATLRSQTPGSRDFFGQAVAVSGDRLAVGTRANGGSVSLYDLRDLSAVPRLLLPTTSQDRGDAYGSALAFSGDTLAVGTPGSDEGGLSIGAVYVHDLSTGGVRRFRPPVAESFLFFGNAVALEGDTLAVGAVGTDSNAGAVYVYDLADRSSPPRLLAPDELESEDRFGQSVAISGDSLVVGAYNDGDRGFRAGAAYVYDLADLAAPPTKLAPSAIDREDSFGWSVAASPEAIVVGAFGDSKLGFQSGAAYVFDPADLEAEPVRLVPADVEGGDRFGAPLAIDDGLLAVGAYTDDDRGADAGAVYLYDLRDRSVEPTKVAPAALGAGDAFAQLFSESVALADGTLAVSAVADDEGGLDFAGAVYVFQ